MAESFNPELQEALQEAGVGPKAARRAARATASAGDMAKVVIWVKSLLAMGGVLVAINVAMLNQLFILTAQVSENKAGIAALTERVGKLEEGQEEIISLLRTRLSENGAGQSGAKIPEISAAPATSPASPRPPTP